MMIKDKKKTVTYSIAREYHDGEIRFLSNDNVFISNISAKDLKAFNTKEEAERNISGHLNSDDPLLNDMMFYQKIMKTDEMIKWGNLKALKPNKKKYASLEDFAQDLYKNRKNTMIFSFDSFYDARDDYSFNKHVKQASGIMLGGSQTFNGVVFDSLRMTKELQLEFLKNKKITFDEAKAFTNASVIAKLKKFIQENHVKNIILWDEGNSYDLNLLDTEGYLALFENTNLILAKQTLVDAIGKKNGLPVSYVCNLLNIHVKNKKVPASTLYSNPYFKVQMIKKICQTYMFQLNDQARTAFFSNRLNK